MHKYSSQNVMQLVPSIAEASRKLTFSYFQNLHSAVCSWKGTLGIFGCILTLPSPHHQDLVVNAENQFHRNDQHWHLPRSQRRRQGRHRRWWSGRPRWGSCGSSGSRGSGTWLKTPPVSPPARIRIKDQGLGTMILCKAIEDQGSRIEDQGSRIEDQGSRIMIKDQDQGLWISMKDQESWFRIKD